MSINPVNCEAIAQDLEPNSLGSCAAATRPAGLVNFYHLTTTPLERALPKLLEKAYGSGARTVVLADESRVEKLNELLWTYGQSSFLPHGAEKDGDVERQPILICHSAAGDSQSAEFHEILRSHLRASQDDKSILCITNGHFAENTEGYSRILDIFDGGNEASLARARARWKRYKDAGLELNYYQQTNAGGWDKKAA